MGVGRTILIVVVIIQIYKWAPVHMVEHPNMPILLCIDLKTKELPVVNSYGTNTPYQAPSHLNYSPST